MPQEGKNVKVKKLNLAFCLYKVTFATKNKKMTPILSFIRALLQVCGGLCLVVLFACSPQQDRKSREFIAEGMKSRKIKRVTDAQLLENVDRLGKQNVEALTEIFLAKTDATQPFVCKTENYWTGNKPFLYVTAVRLVCEAQQAVFEKEKQLLQAYFYNDANSVESTANIQKIDDTAIIYTSPVTLNGKLVGMWTVVFDKKQLVMNTEAKKAY